MALPTNKIKKINPDGVTDYEIIPERLQNSGYEAVLPTLTADSTIALTSQIPDISTKMDKVNPIGTGSLSMNRAIMTTVGSYSTTLGSSNTAAGSYSLAEGYITGAFGNYSHAEGTSTTALDGGHAEGYGKSTSSTFKLTGDANTTSYTIASGVAPKVGTILSYGSGTNKKVARVNTVSGTGTTISMSSTLSSSALSSATVYICNGAAYGISHAEGDRTTASNTGAHAEGYNTFASGSNSHAEGSSTVASGQGSHAEGFYTVASSQYQHVGGKYNIEDTADTYVEIVGNGTSSARSNARTLDWSGNEYLAGNLRAAGLTDGTTTKTMTEVLAGGVDTNYYHTPSYSSGLKIGTGTGVNDLYVPTGTSATSVCVGNDSRLSDSRTPTSHASSATTYGAGTTANYGHVKLGAAEQNGATAADGVAAPNGHTHSQYYLASNPNKYANGTVTSITIKTSGTGLSGGSSTAVTSSGSWTITLDSASSGIAAANKVVTRNAAGSLQSFKYELSKNSSTATTQATISYNDTTQSIDFTFIS